MHVNKMVIIAISRAIGRSEAEISGAKANDQSDRFSGSPRPYDCRYLLDTTDSEGCARSFILWSDLYCFH